jgi:hypothetical protein
LRRLIEAWRDDPGATYRTWFLWEERLKNFRSIKRGIAEVVREIEEGSFGALYKNSSLEMTEVHVSSFEYRAPAARHRARSTLTLVRKATRSAAGLSLIAR